MLQKRRIKLIVGLAIALVVLAVAFMFMPSNISRQEATDIALVHVGGGISNRPDRDFERFRRVWSVEVFYNNLVHEVYISMRTGEVVAVEIDRWD
jgi:lipoprotein signal peptidase